MTTTKKSEVWGAREAQSRHILKKMERMLRDQDEAIETQIAIQGKANTGQLWRKGAMEDMIGIAKAEVERCHLRAREYRFRERALRNAETAELAATIDLNAGSTERQRRDREILESLEPLPENPALELCEPHPYTPAEPVDGDAHMETWMSERETGD